MKKPIALAALSAVMFAHPLYAQDAPAAGAGSDTVMLKVDGEEIKKSEVDAAWTAIFQGHEVKPMDSVDPALKANFLRDLASEHVLYKEAKKENLEDAPGVKEQIENAKHQVLVRKLLMDNTKAAVTDDKLKAAYEAHLKAMNGSHDLDQFKVRHILVKTKDEADAIEKKLKSGTDFTKLAKEKSQDKKSGAEGGELDWITTDKVVPEFGAALLKLKKGEVSPPVKSDFGWHVIQLEDIRAATPPSFADVKDTLEQELGNKAVNDYVKKLMANAKVTQVDAKGNETPLPAPAVKKDDSAE